MSEIALFVDIDRKNFHPIMPKVTVVIPNYNHASYLKARINSVLNQTYQDFEVVYLDDASTDNSDEVLRQYELHPKIRIIRNTQNSGSPFKQWNKGVREAEGEYIWIAEADDYADSHFLETLVALLDKNPQVGLSYCQSWSVDEKNLVLSTLHWWTDDLSQSHWKSDFVNIGQDECANYLSIKNTIPNASAVVFRKSVYEKAGYADETMKICGDWIMWFKILMTCDVAFVAEPMNYFRVHNRSVRSKSSLNGTDVEENYRAYNFVLSRIKVSSTVNQLIRFTMRGMWREFILSNDFKISWQRNREIYRHARKIDDRLSLWMVKTAALWISSNMRHILK